MNTLQIIKDCRAGRLDAAEAMRLLVAKGYKVEDAAYLLYTHGRPPATHMGLYVLGAAFIVGLWLWLYFGPLNY